MKDKMNHILYLQLNLNFIMYLYYGVPLEVSFRDALDYEMMLCAGGEL